MENQLQIFSNPKFGTLRTILIYGAPYFVGKDVTNSLGYVDTDQAIRFNVDEEDKKVLTRKQFEEMALNQDAVKTTVSLFDAEFGGTQRITLINESGLYSLIFSSNLPKAKEFKHWVTSEVLPSIRKYGYYIAPNAKLTFDLIARLIPEIELTDDQINFLKMATPMISDSTSAMIKRLLADYEKNNDVTALVVLDVEGEIWHDVKKFLGFYQISTEGRIKSFQRGKVKIIEPHPNEDGHLHIGLYKDGKTTTYSVHRLVAEAFIPNPDNLPEVAHHDNNPANNRVTNLRWCTRKQNAEYAVENGVYKFGDNHPRSKLTVEKVREIKEKYIPHSKKYGIKALAKEYDVSRSTIEHIVYNQVWKHVQPSQENLLTAESALATEISLFD